MSQADTMERLKAMNGAFAETKIKVYELPPDDGHYECAIESMGPRKAPWDESVLVLDTQLKVVSGKYEGHIFNVTHDLENPDRLEFLKKHLRTLGFPGDDLTALPGFCQVMLDQLVLVNVKTSDKTNEKTGLPYRNAYVMRVLAAGDSASPKSGVTASGEAEDDIPF